ncbi:MAG: hypothetical protein CSB47_11755 [Proteobacteria bacterium]|nr:MAG: hypothetical protein CSB47_11755 [Pseudomonadota bacterium]
MKKIHLLPMVMAFSASSVAVADDWPVGEIDKASTLQNQSISISVLNNDTGNNLVVSGVDDSSKKWGQVTLDADKKTLNYTPYKDFTGTDSFWYELKDDQGRINAAKVIVDVASSTPSGPWPLANTDEVDAEYDSAITIPVLANDVGVKLKLVEVDEWSVNKGKAWISANNQITYQQYGENRGDQQDEFWYTLEDQWGRRNAAKVIVSIKGDPTTSPWPVAVPDVATADNGLRANISVLENDEGAGLEIEEVDETTKQGGEARIFGDKIRYTPPADFSGRDSFWYQFADEQGRTNSAKVTLNVTKNTQKSVVEFCGNTYETDGTKANTRLSDLSPMAPVSYPSTAIRSTGVDGDLGVVNGRRYYVEGDVGSEQVVWMDVDGVLTRVSSIRSDQPTAALAMYKGVFYFTQGGRYLLSHDGERLVEHVDLLQDFVWGIRSPVEISDTNHFKSTIERVEGQGDALHFSVKSMKHIDDPIPTRGELILTTLWRISSDLDWKPVKFAQTRSFRYISSHIREAKNFYYFNGIDYYHFTYRVSTPNNGARDFQAKLVDNGIELDSALGNVEKFIEDRGRLFVLTKYTRDSVPPYTERPSKLYVVDNVNNKFVDLATCPQ